MGDDRRLHYANVRATSMLGLQDPGDIESVRIDGHALSEASEPSGDPSSVGLSELHLPSGDRRAVLTYRGDEFVSGHPGARLLALIDLESLGTDQNSFQARAESLLRSNRDLESFASVVSHDLKGPLRNIESLITWVLDDAGKSLPCTSRRHLEQAQRRTGRLSSMLDDLLTYARLGKEHEQVATITLGRALPELIDLYVPITQFPVGLDPELPSLTAPRALVDLVFRNLLMNAVAHHDRGEGSIAITVEPDEQRHVVVVTDDGPGIPPSHRDRVFELFTSLDRPGDGHSTGMGLAITRRAMEMMGGEITIRTPPDRGVSFVLSWPRSTEQT